MDPATDELYTNLSRCLLQPTVSDSASVLNCFYQFGFFDVTNATVNEVLHRKSLNSNGQHNISSELSSSSGGTSTESKLMRPFVPPISLQILWAVVFGLMVVAAIVGNLAVIWVVYKHREMRSVTNFFLLNLSTADLMMATFNALFNFVHMLTSSWPFGYVYCVFNNFIATLTVSASVSTITATCIDR